MTCPKCNGAGFIYKQWSLKGEAFNTKVDCECSDGDGIKEDQMNAFLDFLKEIQ